MGLVITKGTVFDIKKYALDDGPGIRTTIFLKGCPLRCWWCHNPEGQAPRPELMYKGKRCIGCGECVKSCPKEAISRRAEETSIDRKRCDLCGKCSLKCPTEALVIVGRKMSVGEILKEIEKDSLFYDESEGGVTFSGGEPLLQLGFLNELLRECKDRNLHTALDTSGFALSKAIDLISNKVDLFLYDVKLVDDRRHRKYTGVSNKPILENLGKLAKNGNELLVRIPLVPGINGYEGDIARTAELMHLNGIKRVSLLPYHRSGIEKYRSLGRAYRLKRTRPSSEENLRLTKERFEILGLEARIGGAWDERKGQKTKRTEYQH